MSGLIDRVRAALRVIRSTTPGPPEAEPGAGVPEMLGELGAGLLASSLATSDVQDTLQQLAERYEQPSLRVFVLPTLVMVEDPTSTPSQTAIFPAEQTPLRLDQSAAVERLVRRAFQERVTTADVVATMRRITSDPPRFGPVLSVVGYTLLTIGFGMVLNPTVTALPVYLVLGVVVGTIVLLGSRFATLSLILPVFTAFAVTLLISLLVRPLVHDDVLRLVAPSLVSFLPGLTMTIAAVELTSGQMIAGASRLVYGVARLALLAFGVYAGITVAGEPTVTGPSPEQLGAWAPWVGIVLVGVGYYLFSSAPPRSFIWILYALLVAYSAQLLGNLLTGPQLSGLIGAVIVVPAVYLVGHFRAAPSTGIMLTCAYWLLVPGAIGFIGLSEAASGSSGASSTILQTFGSLIAIAIGMVIGAGLSRDVAAVGRAWRNPQEHTTSPDGRL